MFSDDRARKAAAILEKGGFRRDVAGDGDFFAAVRAFVDMSSLGIGILIGGKYGCGKTLLATILANAYASQFRVYLGSPDQAERLTTRYHEYFAFNPFADNVLLDDLGAESTVNDYGILHEAAGDFICAWHLSHWRGRRLIITTNLTTKEIDARYGGRVLSRLKDLCIPLHLKGDDKRKWSIG